MGYDASIYIQKNNATLSDVDRLLKLLGYTKYNGAYRFFIDDDYKYYCPIWARKNNKSNKEYVIDVRTQIWASSYDLKKINETLYCFKKYLKATFYTDVGKNRYFEEAELLDKAEAGCYYAADRLFNHFSDLKRAIAIFPKDSEAEKAISKIGVISANSINANVYTAYLCSIVEEYFRTTYIALLKYSNKKEKIMSSNKLFEHDLRMVLNGEESIEEAYARTLSFQNIEKICDNFRKLDQKLDISKPLKKSYHRRKESLYESVNRMLEHRHGIIHRLDFNNNYYSNNLSKDINDTIKIIKRVYNYLCEKYNWEKQDLVL